jgi:DNA topoisomerase-1
LRIVASDEDREGEAISWHLLEILKPKVPVKRAVFHEITRDAIIRAFESPRTLNYDLVHAQEARRILDRLAGYTMSPLLWRKISPGLSAGRVQSVGLAMIVRRERERLAFVSADYYDLKANLSTGTGARTFAATLVEAEGKVVASGKDFDADGRLKGAPGEENTTARGGRLVWLGRQEVEVLQARLEAAGTSWSVTRVESKQQRRKPPVPFITSTLQQEANRKLSMSSKECMRVAQSLYEAGWITYMRTDNPVLSEAGRAQARLCVSERYGAENLGPEQRAIKKPKNSQEAHEPIRPAITEEASGGGGGGGGFNMNPPLQGQQLRLYEMILQRTLASVMVDAVLQLTTADVAARLPQAPAAAAPEALFRASGVVVKDPGWMLAYQEGNDVTGGAAAGAGSSAGGAGGVVGGEKELPALVKGQGVGCEEMTCLAHSTRPPARFTEASFVKELEAQVQFKGELEGVVIF